MKKGVSPSGVLVIDKPRGPTSHDVVARLRRSLGTREVGHAGTLDPMASGVLVVLIGEGTKLAPFITAQDKEYEATIELGTETDTLDAEGGITRRASLADEARLALQGTQEPLHPFLETALAAERARTEQVPPAFSAIHTGGERAHERARRGETPVLEPRNVAVRSLRALAAGLVPVPWLTIAVRASKGYFVRSLARDLAAALGTVGHLTALRRTRSGSFGLDEALPPDTPPDEMLARLLPLGISAARALPVARLTDVGVKDARVGRAVRQEDLVAPGPGLCAWVDAKGELVAVGDVDERGVGRVTRGFRPESHGSQV